MVLLIPVGLLMMASLAIFILDLVRPKFGISWLIAATSCIVAWLAIFTLRLRLPTTLVLHSWHHPDLEFIGQFSLLLDYESWAYALALVTITLAVILTDAARTKYDSTPKSWSASLVITAFGLLALLSGSALTLMIMWAFVDILVLIYLLGLKETDQINRRVVISYGARTASILLLFLATIQGWQTIGDFDLSQIPSSAGFLFFLAASLRLAVFSLNLPFQQEPSLRRGVGNILRLAPVTFSLGLLARLPVNFLPGGMVSWTPFFQGLLAITALYAAIRWVFISDEIEGRVFWIIAWAALAATCVLNGAPRASLAWGLALILPGSLVFLYYPRVQRMNFLLYFGLVGLIGLPFTPLASGWNGLVVNGITFWTFLLIITHALMVLGYLNRVIKPGGEAGALEAWARLVYPLGLILIIQAIIALGLIGWPGSLTVGTWWLPLGSHVLIIAVVIAIRRYGASPHDLTQLPTSSRLSQALNLILPGLELVFRFEWLNRFARWLYLLIATVLKSFSIILEGEGGILWTILLLVLLIAILTGGGIN